MRVAAFALAAAVARCADARITEVGLRNFDKETSKPNVLLVFYAPWCGHCRRLEPVLQQLSGEEGAYSVARVDGTEHRVLAQRFGVRGFPSLYYIRSRSEVIAYDGGRGFADLDDFLRRSHKDWKRLSPLKSPFGPVGRAKGWCAAAGLAALDAHEALAESIGEIAAYGVVAVAGLILLVVVLVVPLLVLA